MKQEKTASEWFDMLIEPYCTQAKNNTKKEELDIKHESLQSAIFHSFIWKETAQGFYIWSNLEYSVGGGETTYLKPTDTTEYEKQLEEKFAPELLQPQFGEWIKVEERLPTQQGHYLVVAPQSFPKNCVVVVAEFYDDNNVFYSESSDCPIEDATHWMPLPPDPKD